MYCSSCGAAVAPALSYCNRCGAKMGGVTASQTDSVALLSLDSLVWAIVGVYVFGLGAIMGLLAVMKQVLAFDVGILLIMNRQDAKHAKVLNTYADSG